jgi:hypothetical protein
MNPDRSVERAARSFMEEGSHAAPPRVVEDALRLIEHIPQERDWFPWRFSTMLNPTRVVVLIGVIGAILVSGALFVLQRPASSVGVPEPCTSPASTPSADMQDATAADLRATFTSQTHGYSVRIPCDWTATPASATWAGDAPDATADFMDVLRGPTTRLVAASAPLHGQTPQEWMSAYATRFGLDGVGECDVLPADWPRIMVGTVEGYLDGNGCVAHDSFVPDATFYEAVTFTGDRVYLFWLEGRVSRSAFDALLSTITLEPGAASAASPSPATST